MKPSAKTLRKLLSYCPASGAFVWRVSSGRAVAGAAAGSVSDGGYLVIRIERRGYKAHRLAWLYMTGRWPLSRLDHRDGVTLNNRWANIRKATRSQNMANRKVNRNNVCGLKGVSPLAGRYAANINRGGVRHYLGLFETPEAAHEAYKKKAAELFGEFARAA